LQRLFVGHRFGRELIDFAGPEQGAVFFIDRSRTSILTLSRFDSVAVRFQTGG
jgi:hypothetical protein